MTGPDMKCFWFTTTTSSALEWLRTSVSQGQCPDPEREGACVPSLDYHSLTVAALICPGWKSGRLQADECHPHPRNRAESRGILSGALHRGTHSRAHAHASSYSVSGLPRAALKQPMTFTYSARSSTVRRHECTFASETLPAKSTKNA